MIKGGLARQIVLFGLVGVLATAVHFAVALTLNAPLRVGAMASNLVGYLCAFGVSYLGNSVMTFRRPALVGRQLCRFVVSSLAALCLNQAIVFAGVKLAHYPLDVALIPAVLVVPTAAFILSKFWVFRTPAADPSGGAGGG